MVEYMCEFGPSIGKLCVIHGEKTKQYAILGVSYKKSWSISKTVIHSLEFLLKYAWSYLRSFDKPTFIARDTRSELSFSFLTTKETGMK